MFGFYGRILTVDLSAGSFRIEPVSDERLASGFGGKGLATRLLVEQDVKHSLSLSDRGYVLEHGRVVMEGRAAELMNDPHVKEAYLG